jgi:hypothetical protein
MCHTHAFIDKNTCPCDKCQKRRLDDLEVVISIFLNNLESKIKNKIIDRCDPFFVIDAYQSETPKLPPKTRNVTVVTPSAGDPCDSEFDDEYQAVTKFDQTMTEKNKMLPKKRNMGVTSVTSVTSVTAVTPLAGSNFSVTWDNNDFDKCDPCDVEDNSPEKKKTKIWRHWEQ